VTRFSSSIGVIGVMMSSGPQKLENAISTLVPPTFRTLMKMNRCALDKIIAPHQSERFAQMRIRPSREGLPALFSVPSVS
jgi:hypothetical protein